MSTKMRYLQLKVNDFSSVDKLMKGDRRTLGFLSEETIKSYLRKGNVLGAKTENGELVGYLLYGKTADRFRITHLCVSKGFRSQDIARKLLEGLVAKADTQKEIKLKCRREFSASKMWPRLGFVPLEDVEGRSADRNLLTVWYRNIKEHDQLDLFEAKISDDVLDVVVDSQVFFDIGSDEDNNSESSSLYFGPMSDYFNLLVTNEIFVEIDRHKDRSHRDSNRQRAHHMLITHKEELVEHFESKLKEILPNSTPSQMSDIRHLAKAAASKFGIFITRDKRLLSKSSDIHKSTNLQVMSPAKLIIEQHELLESKAYKPTYVSGSRIKWHRMTSKDITNLSLTSFLMSTEKKHELEDILKSFLLDPSRYDSLLLKDEDKIIAISVQEIKDNTLILHMIRPVLLFSNHSVPLEYLISNTIATAVRKRINLIKINTSALVPELMPHLEDKGFIKNNDSYLRLCFTKSYTHTQLIAEIEKIDPLIKRKYENMGTSEIEYHCSPLDLVDLYKNLFLIPINQGYAISLVDPARSAQDLFGGTPGKLLGWDNVYYRSKTHHNILKSPGKILWYVSGNQGGVVATSHLDEVIINTPKELYRKYKKLGILEWKNLYAICHGDISKQIMALGFSNTISFNQKIPLRQLQVIYEEERGKKLSLQSPLKISKNIFRKIYQIGFEE